MSEYNVPGQFEYEGTLQPGTMCTAKMIDQSRKLRLTPQDILVVTYPKTGTTWMKYLVHLLMNDGEEGDSDVQFLLTTARSLEMKWPHEDEEDIIRLFRDRGPPRLFGTHLPLRLLEQQVLQDGVKVVLVIRNPKDTLVSYYHFCRMSRPLGHFAGTWDEFFQLFKQNRVLCGNYFDHYLGWWKVKDNDSVLIVRYEEMKADLAGVVRKLAKFTGYDVTDDVIQKIAHMGSFEQMKDNPRVNRKNVQMDRVYDFTKSNFIRKGELGDWSNYFTEEQSVYIDILCRERCTPVGLTFQFLK